MLQPAELRKGNLLNWNAKLLHPQTTLPNEIVEVFAVLEDKIAYVYPNIESRVEPFEDDVAQMGKGTIVFAELEPINLTEDWLKKAGLTVNNSTVTEEGKSLQFHWTGTKLSIGNTSIIYLHQLQNYFEDHAGVQLQILV